MSVFELLAMAREVQDADYVKGDRILSDKRYVADTEHMLEFQILSNGEPYGKPGDYCRLFLTGEAYCQLQQKAQEKKIQIIRHARVSGKSLVYGPAARQPALRGK